MGWGKGEGTPPTTFKGSPQEGHCSETTLAGRGGEEEEGGENGVEWGEEEREDLGQGREANLSKHSSPSVPKATMLRMSTPNLCGGLHCWAPWLSSGILCLCLIFLLGQVGLLQGHPQCLDYGPPFQPLLHLEFCSDYESFGCCDQHKDRRIAARYWDVMEYFDLKRHELCGDYIKDILCQVVKSAFQPQGFGCWVAWCGS